MISITFVVFLYILCLYTLVPDYCYFGAMVGEKGVDKLNWEDWKCISL